jgi:hypothetical protein
VPSIARGGLPAPSQWLTPDVITSGKKIERQRYRFRIGYAAMRGVKIRRAFAVQADNLGVNNQRRTEMLPPRYADSVWSNHFR